MISRFSTQHHWDVAPASQVVTHIACMAKKEMTSLLSLLLRLAAKIPPLLTVLKPLTTCGRALTHTATKPWPKIYAQENHNHVVPKMFLILKDLYGLIPFMAYLTMQL